jgi:UDP-N-acetylglucosamine--N-acetylmuramyl-(pentapeptide) pyrophosphoryl-undecaprenol N-acetylglucosamine transferase
MENGKINILVAAGGTGGHLFPAMAVVEQLRYLTNNRVEPYFVGNPNRLESNKVPEAGYKFTPLTLTGFHGLFKVSTLKLPFKILESIKICKRIIKDNNIKAVICAGAYLSYPAGVAAKSCGIPLILMESNINPGKAIKSLTNRSSMIITSFDESEKYFTGKNRNKIKCLGNPVRNFLYSLPNKSEALQKLGLDPNKRTVFIFGGSLGARSLNWAVELDIHAFDENKIQFIWQTGNNYELQEDPPANVKLYKFIDDMATCYAACDIVVSRSGATTVAELALVGKPSILVPLSSASNNEQEHNARYFEKKGASIVMLDKDIQGKLGRMINETALNEDLLKLMGEQALKLSKPNAAINSAKAILNLINEN